MATFTGGALFTYSCRCAQAYRNSAHRCLHPERRCSLGRAMAGLAVQRCEARDQERGSGRLLGVVHGENPQPATGCAAVQQQQLLAQEDP